MNLLLSATGFLLFMVGLLYLYHRIQLLVDHAHNKQYGNKDSLEALQSIISGFWIMVAALILTAVHLPLLLISLLGIAIIFSGMRILRLHLSESNIIDLLKDFRFGFLIFTFGIFLFGVASFSQKEKISQKVVVSPTSTPAKAPAIAPVVSAPARSSLSTEPKKAPTQIDSQASQLSIPAESTDVKKTLPHCTIKKMGYVRSGPSKKYRIIGLSIANSKVKILKSENEYYKVAGAYIPGTSGKNPKKQGTFWIGVVLLNLK